MSDKQEEKKGTKKRVRITKEIELEFLEKLFHSKKSVTAVADEMGIGRTSAYKILQTSKYNQLYSERADIIAKRTQTFLNMQTMMAAKKQLELMNKELPDNLLYLQQNAARDILDRAGVRAKDESKQEVKITFEDGMPEIGMPQSAEEEGNE